MKSLCLILVMVWAPTLVKTKITDGITVSIPSTMFPMSAEDMAQRLPSARAPLGAFTDQDRVVDFTVTTSATQWPDANVDMAGKFFKASLFNLYDRVELIRDGVQEIHKKNFIFYEFTSRISGDRRKQGMENPILKYTYIQYLVQPDRTLVFTFSCPKDQMEMWQPMVQEMMKSIRVR